MATYQLDVKVNGVNQAVTTIGELEQALFETKEELKGLEIGSDGFNQMTNQAKVLQGELERTYEKATNFNSSLTVITESVTRLGSSVAAGFSVALTSMSLFGDESEELTKLQVKSQQALALAFSATTLATNASTISTDIKVVSDKLSLGLTNLLTSAIGRDTIAKASDAAVTGTATVAQRGLNAAMSANPIGLLVIALTTLIGSLIVYKKVTEDAVKSQKQLQDAYQESASSIGSEKAELNSLLIVAKDNNQSLANRRNAIDKINAISPEFLENITLENINTKDATKSIEDYNKALQSKAKQQALVTLTSEKYAEVIALEFQRTDEYWNSLTFIQQQTAGGYNKWWNDLSKEITALEKDIKKIEDAFNNVYTTDSPLTQADKEIQATTDAIDNLWIAAGSGDLDALDELNKKLGTTYDLIGIRSVGAQDAINNFKRDLRLVYEEEKKKEEKDKDTYKGPVQDLKDYNEIVRKLTQARIDNEIASEREKEDFYLERISQRSEVINTATGEIIENYDKMSQAEKDSFDVVVSNTEDLIKEYDERIEKLTTMRTRESQDAMKLFDLEIDNLREVGEEKIKIGLLTEEQLNDQIAILMKDFIDEQVEQRKIYTEQIVEIENDKANKILEIDAILKSELAYGDNNLSDNRQQMALEDVMFEIELQNRRIDAEVRVNAKLIREREALELKRLELSKKSQKEELQIQYEESLKLVQGNERQKASQRKEIHKQYLKDIEKMDKDYASQELEITRSTTQQIRDMRQQLANDIIQFTSQGLNQIISLASAINDIRANEITNQLNEIRDATAEQTNILNNAYNRDLANLDARLAAGLISQEQYSAAVEGMNDKLSKSTLAMNEKQAKKELALKKEAFERNKKLQIASATVAGISGASQAFAGAVGSLGAAGIVVGSILAALVLATSGAQIAAIKKTKFDSGAPSIVGINSSSSGSSSSSDIGGTDTVNNSGGGFTQFSQQLTGTPTGGGGSSESSTGSPVRVYVLESDITNTQRRVSVAESSATFG